MFTKDRNRWPMSVLTFLLNRGLFQRISFLVCSFSCLSQSAHIGGCIDNRARQVLSGTGVRLGQMRFCRMRGAKGVC